MASTIFTDEIVKATELRKKQKHWLEKAYRKPITIPFKHDNLTIINRAEIGRLLEQTTNVKLLIEFWDECQHRRRSKVFPWVNKLNTREQKEFRDNLLEVAIRCLEKGDWSEFQELLEDWKATADAVENPALLRTLSNKTARGRYLALDE